MLSCRPQNARLRVDQLIEAINAMLEAEGEGGRLIEIHDVLDIPIEMGRRGTLRDYVKPEQGRFEDDDS